MTFIVISVSKLWSRINHSIDCDRGKYRSRARAVANARFDPSAFRCFRLYTLPKDLSFMIGLDPEAQSSMQSPETFLQTLTDVVNHLPIQDEPIALL
jgi:hypothetical protein